MMYQGRSCKVEGLGLEFGLWVRGLPLNPKPRIGFWVEVWV